MIYELRIYRCVPGRLPDLLKRAETVKALLVARGIAPASIEAVGRGKRELKVQTGDNVPEAQNRRVEIVVR